MLRTPQGTARSMADLQLALSAMEVSTPRVDPGSAVAARRLGETDVRRLYGTAVVATRRGEDILPTLEATRSSNLATRSSS